MGYYIILGMLKSICHSIAMEFACSYMYMKLVEHIIILCNLIVLRYAKFEICLLHDEDDISYILAIC